MKTWSPDSPCSLPWKKWLKPTSYRLAAEAYVAMCPPTPMPGRFARDTMTAAFHRMLTGPLQQAQHDVPGAGAAAGAHDIVERLDPFPGLVRVYVGQLGGKPVADDRETLTSGSHGISSPSAVVGRLVTAIPVGQGRLVATPCVRGCPDQFWYVRSRNASLPEGSRCSPERVTRGGQGPRGHAGDFRPFSLGRSRASVGTR